MREEGVERVVSEGEGEGDEEAGEVDFSQGGWLWSNDAAAKTQAVLGAKRVRPKKCATRTRQLQTHHPSLLILSCGIIESAEW